MATKRRNGRDGVTLSPQIDLCPEPVRIYFDFRESSQINLSQLAGENLQYIIDVSASATNPWKAGASVAARSLIRPTWKNATGFVYQANAAGQSGGLEPAWPTAAGAMVADGSVTRTAIVPPASGQDSIASVTWTQKNPPDSALAMTDTSNTQLTATVFLGPGTYGQIYTVLATIIMVSSAKFVAEIVLAIV